MKANAQAPSSRGETNNEDGSCGAAGGPGQHCNLTLSPEPTTSNLRPPSSDPLCLNSYSPTLDPVTFTTSGGSNLNGGEEGICGWQSDAGKPFNFQTTISDPRPPTPNLSTCHRGVLVKVAKEDDADAARAERTELSKALFYIQAERRGKKSSGSRYEHDPSHIGAVMSVVRADERLPFDAPLHNWPYHQMEPDRDIYEVYWYSLPEGDGADVEFRGFSWEIIFKKKSRNLLTRFWYSLFYPPCSTSTSTSPTASHPSVFLFLWLCAFVGGRYPRVEDCFTVDNGGNVEAPLVGYRPSSPLLELGVFSPKWLWKEDARGKVSVFLPRACEPIVPMPRGYDTPGASCH